MSKVFVFVLVCCAASARGQEAIHNGTGRQDNASSGGFPGAFWAPPAVDWQHVEVQIPTELRSDYDPRCDSMSPLFQLHNKEVLEKEGLKMHGISSLVGLAKCLWYVVKIMLAIASLPALPVEPVSKWRMDHQEEYVARASQLTLTQEELTCARDFINRVGGAVAVFGRLSEAESETVEVSLEAFKSHQEGQRKFVGPEVDDVGIAWLFVQVAAGKAGACGLPAGTAVKDLILQRYSKQDLMPHTMSVEELLPGSPAFKLDKFEGYLNYRLSAPAKTLGGLVNMPWSAQVQIALFLAQVFQGLVEFVYTCVLGPPYFTTYYSEQWYPMTFRAEVFGPVWYSIARMLIIAGQCVALVGFNPRDSIDALSSGDFNHAPIASHLPFLLCLVLTAVVYVLFPFLPVVFSFFLVLFATLSTLKKFARCPRVLGTAFNVLAVMLWSCCVSYLAKTYWSRDTYLCTFSKLPLLTLTFDMGSVGAYLLLTTLFVAIVMLILAALAVLTLTPKIIGPLFVYRLWVYNSCAWLALALDEPVSQPYKTVMERLEGAQNMNTGHVTEREPLLA